MRKSAKYINALVENYCECKRLTLLAFSYDGIGNILITVAKHGIKGINIVTISELEELV